MVPLVMTWHHVEDLPKIQRPKDHLHHQKDKEEEKVRQKPSLSQRLKHRPHESTAQPAGANAAWALEEEAGYGEVYNELNYITPASACSFYTTFLPTFHAVSTQDNSMEDHPNLGHRSYTLPPSYHLVGGRGV